MNDLKDQAKNSIHDGTDKAKKVAETVADKASEMMGSVRTLAEQAADQSRAGYHEVAERAQQGIRQAGNVVRGYPGLSLSAAFGVGIVAGIVIGISLRPSRRNDWSSHLHRPSWLG